MSVSSFSSAAKPGVCLSTDRPNSPFDGQVIYETDTNRTLVYDNSAWVVISDPSVLSVDSTNNRVGIGTTNPAYPLDVSGDINTSGQVTATNTRTLLDSGHTTLPTSSTIHEIVFSSLPTSDYTQFDIEIDWDNTSQFVPYGWRGEIYTPHNSSWLSLQYSKTRDVTNNNSNFWSGGNPGYIFPAPDYSTQGYQTRSGGYTRMHLSVGGHIWGHHVMKVDPVSSNSSYYLFSAREQGYFPSTNGFFTGFKLVGEDYFGWGSYYQVEFDYKLYGVNV